MDAFLETGKTGGVIVPKYEHSQPHSRDVHVEIRPDRAFDPRMPAASNVGATVRKPRKTLVLCFDGTGELWYCEYVRSADKEGNQFHGDSSDSNILKIFRMLDRSSGKGYHYYQPGIGTYIASANLSSSGTIQKLKHWYIKAKDSAIGTSFDEHVIGGYKFLMQYYSPGDNIYMFGFSRGAYTARFLAEMIDWIGLITHGNEEMIQFGWRTFSKWKAIDSNNEAAKAKQKKAYEFMVGFRETFSRPVRRIRFLGLFDTVTSVPRFENAIMSRQRIPFSAISSAKIIRHAVSIDERRAKFRADLVSHGMASRRDENLRDGIMAKDEHPHRDWVHRSSRYKERAQSIFAAPRKPSVNLLVPSSTAPEPFEFFRGRQDSKNENHVFRYRGHSRAHSHGTHSSNVSVKDDHAGFGRYYHDSRDCSRASIGERDGASLAPPPDIDTDESSDGDEDDQDIDELWFPGGHADIGGGWEPTEGEHPLSHVPLVWIVREAQRSGLGFDEEKMDALNCLDNSVAQGKNMPAIEISDDTGGAKDGGGSYSNFHQILHDTAHKSLLHDCLRFNTGSPAGAVIRWRIMEWIPFRRLDLCDDGKWTPIRWPLPRGEVRDMPADANVHRSAIKRMENNPRYRPGNLILGGGGRGFITAPKGAGIGEWKVVGEEGDVVGERFVRLPKPKIQKSNSNTEKRRRR